MLVVFIIILNAVISYYNASVVGRWWTETKQVGGSARFMSWMGAIMAVCGFFSTYVIIVSILLQVTGGFDFLLSLAGTSAEPGQIELILETIFNLSYLILIFPVLGSGLAIMAHSWIVAYHERNAKNIGIAAWNTFAQSYNSVRAVKLVPKLSKDVRKSLAKLIASMGALAVFLAVFVPVIISIILSILTVVTIIRMADAAYTWETLDAQALKKKAA